MDLAASYTYEAKAVLLNSWRRLHHFRAAEIRKEWRTAFYWLAKESPSKFVGPVEITVIHETKGRLCDVGAPMECVKAAIDGLVDAGVIADDSSHYLHALTFIAPTKTGRDAITLLVEPK